MKSTFNFPSVLACLAAAFFLSTAIAADNNSDPVKYQKTLKEVTALLDNWTGNGADLVQAKAKLDSLLRSDPSAIGAHREYIRYHIMNGNMSGGVVAPQGLAAAEKSLDTALRLKPDDAGSLVIAGHLYYLQNRFADAKTVLTKADSLGTADPWLQLNWADLLMDEGKRDEAASRYQRVLDRNPGNFKVMTAAFEGMIIYYAAKQQPDDVARTYKQQIAYAPSAAGPHGNYALFLLCTRDDAGAAVAEYKKALSLMNYGMARTGLAAATWRLWAAQFEAGQLDQANALLAEAQKLSSADPVQLFAG